MLYWHEIYSVIGNDYLECISNQSCLALSSEERGSLFGNIRDIYHFNRDLLHDLEKCNSDPVAIAECFVAKSEEFHIYTQYCTNYPRSVAVLTECMRNKVLAKFFRERQESLRHSLPLGSYLLKPVQRILKYHLLLHVTARNNYFKVSERVTNLTTLKFIDRAMDARTDHPLYQINSFNHVWRLYSVLFTFVVYKHWNKISLYIKLYIYLFLKNISFIYKYQNECSN
ncbi:unnamed protein product [Oncorhynchus mykiss]|uniref:DH domain-containing protein n=1 Tax=Oncorhynchus mykiss TaxID=8022 RepID=A0A060XSB6_ONCMY|nr:unnamed protein product [Oncorhynchus mykiss]